ncbi:MAG: hypothetical protein QME14_09230 [Methanobacteriaceae archaeon]|nr:hypothetical protein [Methanobacteriaceae archaeon]
MYPNGDALTHLGWVNFILLNGNLESADFYPFMHILATIITDLINVDYMQLITIIYISGYILYLLSMNLLAKVISNSENQTILITIFSVPLIFSFLLTSIHPFIFAIYLIPLLLYFYFSGEKTNKIQNRILLLIIAVCIVFIHPIIAFFIILILIGLVSSRFIHQNLGELISSWFKHQNFDKHNSKLSKYSLGLPFLVFVIFFTWYISFIGIQRNIKRVANSLINGIGSGVLYSQLNTLNSANVSIFQSISIFIYNYGGIALYLLLFAILMILFLNSVRTKSVKLNELNFVILAILISVVSSGFLFFNFIVAEPIRVLALPLIIIITCNGLLFYHIEGINLSKTRSKIIRSLLLLLILSTLVIGIFNVYGSDRTVVINLQVTNMDINGMDWSIDYMDKNINITQAKILVKRFQDLRLKSYEFNEIWMNTSKYTPQLIFKVDQNDTPTHFGYDENYPISKTFNFEDHYMILTKAGIIGNNILPYNVRDKGHQYTDDDFKKLNNDTTITKIFDNGEFQVWRIYG